MCESQEVIRQLQKSKEESSKEVTAQHAYKTTHQN